MVNTGDDRFCSDSGDDEYVKDKGSSSPEPDVAARSRERAGWGVGGKGRDHPDVRAGGRGLRGEGWMGRGEVGGRFAKGLSVALVRGCKGVFVGRSGGGGGGGVCRAESEGKEAGAAGDGNGCPAGEGRGGLISSSVSISTSITSRCLPFSRPIYEKSSCTGIPVSLNRNTFLNGGAGNLDRGGVEGSLSSSLSTSLSEQSEGVAPSVSEDGGRCLLSAEESRLD